VTPILAARVGIAAIGDDPVHAIALRCQVRIEPQRRRYEDGEQEGLRGLFGERERWAETLKPFQWMQCNTTVQGFTARTETDLALPCTYDLDVIGTRYLHALNAGAIPLSLLFSGTVFTRGNTGFGVEQIPWDCEARYQLPVAVWQQMITLYFPNTGWLRLDAELLTRLAAYRARHGLTSWEETMEKLLGEATS
jgi:hypothetical protein